MVDVLMNVGGVLLTHRLFTEAFYATLPWDSRFVWSQLGRKHTGPVESCSLQCLDLRLRPVAM